MARYELMDLATGNLAGIYGAEEAAPRGVAAHLARALRGDRRRRAREPAGVLRWLRLPHAATRAGIREAVL